MGCCGRRLRGKGKRRLNIDVFRCVQTSIGRVIYVWSKFFLTEANLISLSFFCVFSGVNYKSSSDLAYLFSPEIHLAELLIVEWISLRISFSSVLELSVETFSTLFRRYFGNLWKFGHFGFDWIFLFFNNWSLDHAL